MALYPGAVKELIAPGANDPRITAIGIILHTDAGNVGDLHDYFDGPSGGIESHFHVPKSAAVKQYRDTAYEADANYHGNSFEVDGERLGFISVETQGLASDPWNDYQLAEIKKLILWAKSVHPRILLRVCPAWNKPGIGYHTLFGSPGPWTPVAKSCPGPKRIQQFNDVLVPWFANATTPTEPEEDDMPDINEVRAVVADELNKQDRDLWAAPTGTGTHFIANTKAGLGALAKQNAAITAQLAGLTSAVQALAQNQGLDPAAVLAAVTAATEKGVDKALADLKITLSTDDGTN